MGLFDKIKNMFTEEEEEYEEEKEPIKKEVFQVEIPAPKIEEKKEEVKEEPKKEVKREEKFVFPVYFDDSDFEEEPPKKEPVQPYRETPYVPAQRAVREERERRVVAPQPKEEPKKKFKLSPVISPVYGILDKNYKKEDIIEKKREPEDYFGYKGDTALRVDKVRKKAYGTLEDELESTLSHVEIEDYKEVEQVVTKSTKEELEKEATAAELEDMFFTNDMTLEDAINQYDKKSNEKVEEKDDLIESDLFNLIDSMYDKETKEEE